MKALFLDTPSFGKKDMISAFEQCGIEITLFYHDAIRDYPSQAFDAYFDSLAAGESYSFVYSFNYYPAVSNGCMRNGLKYLAFVYDNPLLSLYSYTMINPCNYVFLFDKTCYETFAREGIPTVYYLPLCANTGRKSSGRAAKICFPIASAR